MHSSWLPTPWQNLCQDQILHFHLNKGLICVSWNYKRTILFLRTKQLYHNWYLINNFEMKVTYPNLFVGNYVLTYLAGRPKLTSFVSQSLVQVIDLWYWKRFGNRKNFCRGRIVRIIEQLSRKIMFCNMNFSDLDGLHRWNKYDMKIYDIF